MTLDQEINRESQRPDSKRLTQFFFLAALAGFGVLRAQDSKKPESQIKMPAQEIKYQQPTEFKPETIQTFYGGEEPVIYSF